MDPMASNSRKRRKRMRKTPASGGVTNPKPGKNLATRSERAPCLENIPCVRRTQESGSREIRKRRVKIFNPLGAPKKKQQRSEDKGPDPRKKGGGKKIKTPRPGKPPRRKQQRHRRNGHA